MVNSAFTAETGGAAHPPAASAYGEFPTSTGRMPHTTPATPVIVNEKAVPGVIESPDADQANRVPEAGTLATTAAPNAAGPMPTGASRYGDTVSVTVSVVSVAVPVLRTVIR